MAIRELRSGVSGFRIFLTCLILGVGTISAIGTVKSGIEIAISEKGSELLGGNAEAEFTYRLATTEELKWLETISQNISGIIEFRSMAKFVEGGANERALTQVKAVDNEYPLIGNVQLVSGKSFKDVFRQPKSAVMESDLASRLGINIGETFSLGLTKFVLRDIIQSSPDDAGTNFGLGPRTIIKSEDLLDSGLIAPGTLFTAKYRLLIEPLKDLDELRALAKIKFENNGMRWRDARNGAPGISEFVSRLSAFFIMVGLAGLVVGGVGIGSAVKSYLNRKISTIAVMRSLGATNFQIFMTYFVQLAIISFIGITIGLVIGASVPHLCAPLLKVLIPIPISIVFSIKPIAEAAIYGTIIATLFTLWPLSRCENIKAAALFREMNLIKDGFPRLKYLVLSFILVLILLIISAVFNQNPELTSWFALGFTVALVTLFLSARILMYCIKKFSRIINGHPSTRWALAAMGGTQEGTNNSLIAIGLGLTVLAIIGQVDGNLRTSINNNLPEVAPSYFVIDIQKSQIEEVRDILNSNKGVISFDEAPMLRGIITKINNKQASEVAGDHWVIRGDRGVTYFEELPKRFNLTKGQLWPKDYSGATQISFAAEQAEELGIGIGDSVTVNIMGREITGEITSLRNVDFSSAGIGFVIAMNPSALKAAPHSFIMTIYASTEAETAVFNNLSSRFSNITLIKVRNVIERVSNLLSSIATASSYGALTTLAMGFLVLLGSAASGQSARSYDAAILKTLGATRKDLIISYIIRFSLVGATAGLVAIFFAVGGAWCITSLVLELPFKIIWDTALMIIIGGLIANLVAGLYFATQALKVKPANFLRAQ
ncbi:MAG: FtsX-like permease family protein [Rhodobacterales bacterium]|nr:FtsX-like permease family protein [Rhodobacterales bacterium]